MKSERKTFLEFLAESLCKDNIEKRVNDFEDKHVTLHKHVALVIETTDRKLELQKQSLPITL